MKTNSSIQGMKGNILKMLELSCKVSEIPLIIFP